MPSLCVEIGDGDPALAAGARRAARARRAPAASARCRSTTPPGTSGSTSRPSRSRRPSSCRSRSPCATRSSGRSRCSACRGRGCRRSCPCCAGAASRPAPRPATARARARAAARRRTMSVSVDAGADRDRAVRPSTTPRSSATPRSPTSARGACCRRFMFGSRSVPPATQHRVGRRFAPASPPPRRAMRGARYSKRGRRIMTAPPPMRASTPASALRRRLRAGSFDARAVAALPRRRHQQRLGPRDVGERRRPEARRLARGLRPAAPCRIFSGVTGISSMRTPTASNTALATRRHDRQQRPLPDFLGAERPVGIGILDQVGEDLRHVEAGRALVLEHRRELVHERVREPRRQPAERLLLHQRLAEAHVDAALDLPAHQRRVERRGRCRARSTRAAPRSSPVSGSTSTSTTAAV